MNALSLTLLYQRLAPRVFRRALGLLRDTEDARDVTQDTFLAYLQSQTRLRGEASPGTVLYEIATHKALDCLRRRARRRLREEAPRAVEDEATGVPEDPASPDGGGIGRMEALHDLKLLTRGESPQVLQGAHLYFVEGYTFEEVGRELRCSRRAISRRLTQLSVRARRRSG
jgi:RNA polymerase sigma-70 factor (ECF subfamily)